MNPEQPKHSKLGQLTGVIAASAALIAAVSTAYVNLRSQPAPASAPESAAAAVPGSAASASPAAVAAAPQPVALVLRLDRVQVENDGSMGTTDWNFEIRAAREPPFTPPVPPPGRKPF